MCEKTSRAASEKWDADELSTTLHAPAAAVSHGEHGDGQLFLVGEQQATMLEVYPAQGIVRVTGGGIELTLSHQGSAQLKPEGVIFRQQYDGTTTRLLVASNGEVLLGISPSHFAEPLEGLKAGFVGEVPPQPRKRARNDSTAPQHYEGEGSLPPATQGEEKKKEYVVVRGRVGKAPTLRTTARGVLIARFQLNTTWDQEDENADWQQVIAFNKRAALVQEKVQSGKVVEVRGYVHDRVRKMEGGATTTTQEIYLAAVKTPR